MAEGVLLQNVTTNCDNRLLQTNQNKISRISDTFIYFPDGKWCKCTQNATYFLMKNGLNM